MPDGHIGRDADDREASSSFWPMLWNTAYCFDAPGKAAPMYPSCGAFVCRRHRRTID